MRSSWPSSVLTQSPSHQQQHQIRMDGIQDLQPANREAGNDATWTELEIQLTSFKMRDTTPQSVMGVERMVVVVVLVPETAFLEPELDEEL